MTKDLMKEAFPPRPEERAVLGEAMLLGLCSFLAVMALLGMLCGGCVYKGAKITEGTNLILGMDVPTTEGAFQFDLLNFTTGFSLGVAENARLEVEYSTVSTNSYFGVVRTETAKHVKATVEPCETAAPTTNAAPDSAASTPTNAADPQSI
jgi:hypothetical protein